ncbi:putative membrane protein (TIGR02234 family) [Lipingzhangella halophila]|uniref:Putative membrane protein (TIGR02234 family) n=1 Tax=Lipingzhangella halophila TaxID=1783352 RepID=A0A7W7W246_9ACTN|nr:Trp biosynthesis-associated membrane protein [Lipingzhangella halophila]MBB4931018.1 putative membrane protein (TIGR02234 family) [Lipingzhangella halophila]
MSRPDRSRREFTIALLATLAGAAALLATAGQTWAVAEVSVAGPSEPANVDLAGDDVAPAAAAIGWAALAALAALLAAQGWARRGLGVLLIVFAGVALYDVWTGTRPGALARAAAAQATVGGDAGAPALHASWPLLAACGALLLLGTGAATAIRGAAWPGMGSRYDRHGAPATVRSGDPAEMWKSLDSGADPTVDPGQGDGSTGTAPATASHDNVDAKEP